MGSQLRIKGEKRLSVQVISQRSRHWAEHGITQYLTEKPSYCQTIHLLYVLSNGSFHICFVVCHLDFCSSPSNQALFPTAKTILTTLSIDTFPSKDFSPLLLPAQHRLPISYLSPPREPLQKMGPF